jgi:hypothetical protein
MSCGCKWKSRGTLKRTMYCRLERIAGDDQLVIERSHTEKVQKVRCHELVEKATILPDQF